MPALPRGDKALPVGDGEIDRRQRPCAQDRTGNDDACGSLLIDDQIGANAEHSGLQHHPHHLGNRAKAARNITGPLIGCEIIAIGFFPPLADTACHAHGGQHLGVAAAGERQILTPHRQRRGALHGIMRQVFGQDGQCDQEHSATQRGQTDQRMERETDGEVQRQPWQIEQRTRPHPGEERAHIVEVAERLKPFAAVTDEQRHAHNDIVDPAAEHLVQCRSYADQDTAADQVENALNHIETARQHDQTDERRNAAARQHTVIDLEHEERAGQIKNIDDAAHHTDADKGAAAGAQRRAEFGTGRRRMTGCLGGLHRYLACRRPSEQQFAGHESTGPAGPIMP